MSGIIFSSLNFAATTLYLQIPADDGLDQESHRHRQPLVVGKRVQTP